MSVECGAPVGFSGNNRNMAALGASVVISVPGVDYAGLCGMLRVGRIART